MIWYTKEKFLQVACFISRVKSNSICIIYSIYYLSTSTIYSIVRDYTILIKVACELDITTYYNSIEDSTIA